MGRFVRGGVVNAKSDFDAIQKASSPIPEWLWRDDSLKRSIKVTFENETVWDQAKAAAQEKYPVESGSALHEYIETCLQELVGNAASFTAVT